MNNSTFILYRKRIMAVLRERVFLKKEMEDRIMIKLNGGSDGACKEIF